MAGTTAPSTLTLTLTLTRYDRAFQDITSYNSYAVLVRERTSPRDPACATAAPTSLPPVLMLRGTWAVMTTTVLALAVSPHSNLNPLEPSPTLTLTLTPNPDAGDAVAGDARGGTSGAGVG